MDAAWNYIVRPVSKKENTPAGEMVKSILARVGELAQW